MRLNEIEWDDDAMSHVQPDSSDEFVDPIVWLRAMAVQIAKGILPYPDLFRRTQVRRRARSLVRFTPWPGNDATPLQLAQLCLVRSLALQRQTHRLVRWRQREAAALLARTSVENTILGLWCLYSKDPMERLRGGVGKAMKDSLKYLYEGDVLRTALIDLLVEEVGGSESLPNVFEMADTVRREADSNLTTDLYKRLYTPLSAFFAHSNGPVLMRHVKSNGAPRFRPSYPWNRRGPARAADACLGVLALAVCNRTTVSKQNPEYFEKYANAHMARTLAPVPVMLGRGSRRTIRWSRIPVAIARLRDGARYLHSSQGASDTWNVREARVRSDVTVMMSVFQTQATSRFFPKVVDILVNMLVGEDPERSEGNGSA
jgi:hypothetical protein